MSKRIKYEVETETAEVISFEISRKEKYNPRSDIECYMRFPNEKSGMYLSLNDVQDLRNLIMEISDVMYNEKQKLEKKNV